MASGDDAVPRMMPLKMKLMMVLMMMMRTTASGAAVVSIALSYRNTFHFPRRIFFGRALCISKLCTGIWKILRRFVWKVGLVSTPAKRPSRESCKKHKSQMHLPPPMIPSWLLLLRFSCWGNHFSTVHAFSGIMKWPPFEIHQSPSFIIIHCI